MFWTYILYAEKSDKYYIGFTKNIEMRLASHNHPKNKGYTKRYQPWILVYSKAFNSKEDAMNHENYLKSLKSKKAIQELINIK